MYIGSRKADEMPIVFAHGPKTAGGVFWLHAISAAASTKLYPSSSDTQSCHGEHHCTPSELQSICFINKKPRFVTLLREPTKRVVSEYFWALKEKRRKISQGFQGQFDWTLTDWQKLLHRPSNLAEWVASPHNTAHNRQMRFLAGYTLKKDETSCIFTNSSKTMVLAELRYGANPLARRGFAALVATDSELKQRAVEQVKDIFFFVGLSEKLTDSLQCFFHRLQILPLPYHQINTQSVKHASHSPFSRLPQKLVQDIARRNRADLVVYAAAKERFSRDCGHNIESRGIASKTSKTTHPSILVVTAFSHNHASEAQSLVATAQRAQLSLIIYDLGLWEEDYTFLQSACGIEVIRRLPSSLDRRSLQLYGCAWKPPIIADTMSRHPTSYVVWADASVRFRQHAVLHIRNALSQQPLMARKTIGDVGSYTHPITVQQVFNASSSSHQYLDKTMLAATVVGLTPAAKPFIDLWAHWCLNPSAFQPVTARGQPCNTCQTYHTNGHCYRCHRYDQSIFNLLFYWALSDRAEAPLLPFLSSIHSVEAMHNATSMATSTKRGQRQLPRGLSVRWCGNRKNGFSSKLITEGKRGGAAP